LKSNKTDNRNIKREYQRSIEVLRQTVQMNNEEEQNIRKYINRSKEVERELAFVESQISLTHESIKKNNREDVGITKSVEQIDRSVASMMNNQ
jgi:transposase